MESEVGAQQDFIAAVMFNGVRSGFVFRAGEQGVGYYRDEPAKKRQKVESALHPPPPLPPPLPPPAQPLQSPLPLLPSPLHPTNPLPPASGFWDQLQEFEQELDVGCAQRPPSPPARLPARGTSEVLQWRGKRGQPSPKPRQPHIWPRVVAAAPKTTMPAVPPSLDVPSQPTAASSAAPQIDVDALLAERTQGTVPGSRDWIRALRDSVRDLAPAMPVFDGNAALDSLAASYLQRGDSELAACTVRCHAHGSDLALSATLYLHYKLCTAITLSMRADKTIIKIATNIMIKHTNYHTSILLIYLHIKVQNFFRLRRKK